MKKFFALILIWVFLFLPATASANYYMFSAPVTGTATSTSTKVLNQNNLRSYLIIINNSSTVTLYVKFGSAQSGTEGVTIPPLGNYEPFKAPANSVYLDTASSTAAYTIIQGQ